MNTGPIEHLVSERNDLLEIILTVAFLSAGVNILVTSSLLWQMVVGIGLVAMSIYMLIETKSLQLKENVEYKAVLPYDTSRNQIFEIPGYYLSKLFKMNMEAAISEKQDIEAIWDNRPITESDPFRVHSNEDNTSAIKLTEEMFEYILLSKLSTTTKDYFDDKSIETKTYKRDELPDILLTNRFVSLFSKPMDDRAAFQDQPNRDDEELPEHVVSAETVAAWGDDGEKFEKFTLTLPKNCSVSRDENGRIVIESNTITLKISANSKGYSTYLDHDIVLLDQDIEPLDVSLKQMTVSMSVNIGYLSLLKDISSEYKWVDEYIQKVQNDMSINKYKSEMNIPQLKLISTIIKNEGEIQTEY